ncbi:MAG: type II toxin-antitoxin system HicB family antitoxin [Anaerolineaceae bacterium]
MAKTQQEHATILSKYPYTVELFRDKTTDGDYIFLARNPELEGCMAQGLTEEEALSNLNEVRIEHIEHLLEHHLPVPYPNRAVASSQVSGGNIVLRELPAINLSGIKEHLTKEVQPDTKELVFSSTPIK